MNRSVGEVVVLVVVLISVVRWPFPSSQTNWIGPVSAADKSGANEDRFYRDLIRLADSRFAGHFAT